MQLTQDSPALAKFRLDEFLQTLSSPRFMDPEHTGPILLTGKIGEFEVAFWASPFDPMDYGRNLYEKVLAGEYGEIAEYVEPEPQAEPDQKDLF